jgi:hypothetical protein
LGSITVPAGTWLVTGGLRLTDWASVANTVHAGGARLRFGTTVVPSSQVIATLVEGASAANSATLPSASLAPRGVVTTTGPSTAITLDACRMETTSMTAGQVRLDALRVATATEQ